jgi:hypothetical protein
MLAETLSSLSYAACTHPDIEIEASQKPPMRSHFAHLPNMRSNPT